jgi:hypothetical protein
MEDVLRVIEVPLNLLTTRILHARPSLFATLSAKRTSRGVTMF